MYESIGVYEKLSKSLQEKEEIITELNRALTAYRSFFSIFQRVAHPIKWSASKASCAKKNLINYIAPRLGNLNQHAPHKLALPAHYYKIINLSQTPKISIVTPSFKQAQFIERTIKSVLDQTYSNLEYYIQDGDSGDGTKEILEKYASALTGWESRPDSGQSNAINLAFAKTTGDIMAWLNSDDILLPGALAYIAEYFNQHPEIDVVYGHRILIDENDQQIGRWIMPAHNNEILSWADYIPQETLFWRRHIWDRAGGKIDESFRFAMDWDLLVRFRNAGARFACLPRFLGGFRIHSSQKTSAEISDIGFREMGRIRESVFGRIPSQLAIQKAVAPYLFKHIIADLILWRIFRKF
jgi:glycosyltransferase involved in cell wall biosynthesis